MSSLSTDYEHFIMSLIQDIKGSHRDISDIGFGRDNTLTGMCGQPHQIDVSFVDHDFQEPTLVLIECKRRTADHIKLEDVKVLKATMDDILIAEHTPKHLKGIIVTTRGAQEGAIRFADYYGIMIEKVTHGPEYIFRYENILQAALTESPQLCCSSSIEVYRNCQLCGVRFEVQGIERLCQNCRLCKP